MSKDDLHNQRAARKGIGVKLALPPRLLYAPLAKGNREREEKKGFDNHHILCTPKFPRSCGSVMKTVRKKKEKNSTE